MKNNVRFDDAKRRLDAALEEIAAAEPPAPAAPPAPDPGPERPEGPPPVRDPALPPGVYTRPDLPPDPPGTYARTDPPPARPDEAPRRPANFGAPRRLLQRQGPAESPARPEPRRPTGGSTPAPAQTSEALARLVVGAAVLGLDALAARAETWEQRAGIGDGAEPGGGGAPRSAPAEGEARFRHGLIGWIFETEEELRPRGNPLQWLRTVVGHLFSTIFSVVFDSLPRLGRRRPRGAEPSDQDTARWVARGRLEERRSRAFAVAALEDIIGVAIPYFAGQRGVQEAIAQLVRSPAMDDAIVTLARREGVQQAVAELVRSPAMDDAIVTLARREGVQQAVAQLVRSPMMDDAITTLAARPGVQDAVAQLVRSPAMDDAIVTLARREGVQRAVAELVDSPTISDAVTSIVRSPAMEDAVTYLVGTQAMTNAIETLSKSPALVQLVQTQGTSIAGEVVEEVRERGVSGDVVVEGFARRLLGRPPRSQLPPEAQGLVVHEPGRRPERRTKP